MFQPMKSTRVYKMPDDPILDAATVERACICQVLRRVTRKVTQRYAAALKPVNLTAGQFTILAALSRNKPVKLSTLADEIGMDRTTLTKDLAPLERRNLVSSIPNKSDRRVRDLKLSENGKDLLRQAHPLWEAAQISSLEKIGDADWTEVRSVLDTLAP